MIDLLCNTKNPAGVTEEDGCEYESLITNQYQDGIKKCLPCQIMGHRLRRINLFCMVEQGLCAWNDNFTGEDGDPLDASRWDYDSGYDYLIEIKNNMLYLIGDYYYNNIITNKGCLSAGDFEVGIFYEFDHDWYGDVYYNDIIFRAYNETTGDDSYIKHHIWGHNVEPAESENYIETGGVHHTVTQVNIPGYAGNFSIKRAGTDIELYAMGSLMATFADESYNKISITHIGYFTPNSLYVNDFIFKSGCPPGSP